MLLFEGAARFAAGGVVGNACRRYSCCCVFCNCCVFELISLEGAPRFVAGRVVGNACRRYSCCCVFCYCCVFAFVFKFCKPSAAVIRSLIKFCCRCILPALI